MSVSTSHLLSLGITEGKIVRVVPLAAPGVKVAGLPSLKHAKDATDIRLKEIGQLSPKATEKDKLDWLTLASREALGLSRFSSITQQAPDIDSDICSRFEVRAA